MIDNDVVEECNKVTEALSSVLEIPIDKANKANLGLIGLYYSDLEAGLQKGNHTLAQRSLEKLRRLLGELVAAKLFYKEKDYDFSDTVQKLTSDEPHNSLGTRAELMVLSLLLEYYFQDEKLFLDDITKRESPDYSVNTPKGEVFFEVTHVHIRQAKKNSAGYKISRAIRAKSNKPYANRNTALFLDITNLTYREIESGRIPNSLDTYIEKTFPTSKYGAVVVVQGAFTSVGKYIPLYRTFLHDEASEALGDFLNDYYPNRFDNQKFYTSPTT